MCKYAFPAQVHISPDNAAGALLYGSSLSDALYSEAQLSESLRIELRNPPEWEEVYYLVHACVACSCTAEVSISGALLS